MHWTNSSSAAAAASHSGDDIPAGPGADPAGDTDHPVGKFPLVAIKDYGGFAEIDRLQVLTEAADSRLIYRLIEYNMQIVGDVDAMVVSVLQPEPEREDFRLRIIVTEDDYPVLDSFSHLERSGASFNLEVLVLRRVDFANTVVTRLAGPVVLSNNRNDRGAEAFSQDLTVQVSKVMEQRHNRGLADTLRALKVTSE